MNVKFKCGRTFCENTMNVDQWEKDKGLCHACKGDKSLRDSENKKLKAHNERIKLSQLVAWFKDVTLLAEVGAPMELNPTKAKELLAYLEKQNKAKV